jgi:hypothetical protein
MRPCAKCKQPKSETEFANPHRCKTCQSKLDKRDADMRRRYAHAETVAKLQKNVKKCLRCDTFIKVGPPRLCVQCQNPTHKHCPGCRLTKPSNEFSINGRSADGLQSYCKACNKEAYVSRSRPTTANTLTVPRQKPCIECRRTLPAKAFTLVKPGQLSLACIECQQKQGDKK